VLDDYQSVALETANWSRLGPDAQVDVFQDAIDKGMTDGYQTLARGSAAAENGFEALAKEVDTLGIWGDFSKLLPSILNADDIVTSEARNLFKYPFMTFNYGAMISSIRKSVGFNMVEKMATKMLDTESAEYELLKTILTNAGKSTGKPRDRQYKISRYVNPTSGLLRVKAFDEIMIDVKNEADVIVQKSLSQILRELVDATYGQSIEDNLTDTFSGLIEVNEAVNNASKVMTIAYKLAYNKEIAKFNKKNGRFPSAAEKLEIFDKLRPMFPLIKSPSAEDASEGAAIVTQRTENATHLGITQQVAVQPGSNVYKDNDGKHKRNVVFFAAQTVIDEFEAAMASGGVLPIHWSDGDVMADTMNFARGTILGVHDAILPPLLQADEFAKHYNEYLIEQSKRYSMVNATLQSFKDFYETLTPETMAEVDQELADRAADKRITAIKERGESFKDPDIAHTTNSAMFQLFNVGDKVNTAREELWAHDVKMSQMPLTKDSTAIAAGDVGYVAPDAVEMPTIIVPAPQVTDMRKLVGDKSASSITKLYAKLDETLEVNSDVTNEVYAAMRIVVPAAFKDYTEASIKEVVGLVRAALPKGSGLTPADINKYVMPAVKQYAGWLKRNSAILQSANETVKRELKQAKYSDEAIKIIMPKFECK